MKLKALIADLKKIDVLEDRVFTVFIPSNTRKWPSCVVRRAGGVDLAIEAGEGGGVKIPLVEITVLSDKYEQIEGAMIEVQARVNRLSWTVFDPPDDAWHDTLKVYSQTVTVLLEP